MEMLCRISQRRCILRAMFTIPYCSGVTIEDVKSPEFCINEAVTFQVKVISERNNDYDLSSFKNTVFIKIAKKYDDTPNYLVDLSSRMFKLTEQFKADESSHISWRFLLTSTNNYEYTFDLNLTVHLDTCQNFSTLYYSEFATDFDIKCLDGIVSFHKAVLAAASNVFMQNFTGKWLKENEASLDIYGLKVDTLEDLKRYLYLNVLPNVGLEKLLLIAVVYEIRDLEQKCLDKIVISLNAGNAFQMAEFAMENGFMELYFEILECLSLREIQVGEMKKYLNKTLEVY